MIVDERIFWRGSSEIDWCEYNYVKSNVIAEFFNSTSNIVFLPLPILQIYLFQSYARKIGPGCNVVWLLMIVVGIGSFYFHSTLSFAGQLIDEAAIGWVMIAGYVIWIPDSWIPSGLSRTGLQKLSCLVAVLELVAGVLKPAVNAVVLLLFTIPLGLSLYLSSRKQGGPQTQRLFYRALFWIIISVILWVTDRINCHFWLEVRFPYLHSIFHITALEGSYVAAVLSAYVHARNQGFSQAEIHYWPTDTSFYGVPYVTVENGNHISAKAIPNRA